MNILGLGPLKQLPQAISKAAETLITKIIKRSLPFESDDYFTPEKGFVYKGRILSNREAYTKKDEVGFLFLKTTPLTNTLENSPKDSRFICQTFPFEQVFKSLQKAIEAKDETRKPILFHQARVLFQEYRRRQWEQLGIPVDHVFFIDPLGRWEVRKNVERTDLSSTKMTHLMVEDISRFFYLEKLLGIELLGTEEKPAIFMACGQHAVTEPFWGNQQFIDGDIKERHKKLLPKIGLPDQAKINLETLYSEADSIQKGRNQFLEKISQFVDIEKDSKFLAVALLAVDRLSKNGNFCWEEAFEKLVGGGFSSSFVPCKGRSSKQTEDSLRERARSEAEKCRKKPQNSFAKASKDNDFSKRSMESIATAMHALAQSQLDREVTKKELFEQALKIVRNIDTLVRGVHPKFDAKAFTQQQEWLRQGFIRMLNRYLSQTILETDDISGGDLIEELKEYLDSCQRKDSPMLQDGWTYRDHLLELIKDDWMDGYNEPENTLQERVYILRWLYKKANDEKEQKKLFLQLNQLLHDSIG